MNSESQTRENTIASLAALYPQAFILATAANSRLGLALRYSEIPGSNLPIVHGWGSRHRDGSDIVPPGWQSNRKLETQSK
jgi:hypothetical protein